MVCDAVNTPATLIAVRETSWARQRHAGPSARLNGPAAAHRINIFGHDPS